MLENNSTSSNFFEFTEQFSDTQAKLGDSPSFKRIMDHAHYLGSQSAMHRLIALHLGILEFCKACDAKQIKAEGELLGHLSTLCAAAIICFTIEGEVFGLDELIQMGSGSR